MAASQAKATQGGGPEALTRGRRRLINYPRANRRGFRRWIPSVRLVLATAFSAVLLALAGFAAAVAFVPVPEPNDIAIAERSIVYYRDGETEIGRFGEANRVSIGLDEVPEHLQEAVLAAEDRGFYDHGGFDPGALVRAGWNSVTGGSVQGGSTITQQYAKNAYLTHDQTMTRKLRELVLAVKLDVSSSKEDILQDYLNTIYFGRGAYGVETAAWAYYNKPAKALNRRESVALAAMIQAPSFYDPDTNRSDLERRFDYVRSGMLEKGWITPAQNEKLRLPRFAKYAKAANYYSGTNGYLLDAVERQLLTMGFSEKELAAGGFRIVTTFDENDQAAAVNAVRNAGPPAAPGLRMGLASVDVQTGEVLAMYGGQDYLERQLSDADQSIALAGSTFKPFALAAAAEAGISLYSTWDGNSPRTIDGYTLQNEGNSSYGTINLIQASANSVNTVFVELGNRVGNEKVREAAIRAGVPENTMGLGADPTTVLGTASPTALDMASAYATFANGGVRAEPTKILELRRHGKLEYSFTPTTTRVFSTETAEYVNTALQAVVTSGSGRAATALGRPAAGKTGTSDNNRSAWFVGYTPQVSTAVMMAKQDAAGNSISLRGTGGMYSVYGGSYPASIWTAYMIPVMSGLPYESFTGSGSGWAPQVPATPSESPSESPSQTPRPSRTPTPTPTLTPTPTPQPTASTAPSATASPTP